MNKHERNVKPNVLGPVVTLITECSVPGRTEGNQSVLGLVNLEPKTLNTAVSSA